MACSPGTPNHFWKGMAAVQRARDDPQHLRQESLRPRQRSLAPSLCDLLAWAVVHPVPGEHALLAREPLRGQLERLRELTRERLVADREHEFHDLGFGE